jgi:hypothetical protein
MAKHFELILFKSREAGFGSTHGIVHAGLASLSSFQSVQRFSSVCGS